MLSIKENVSLKDKNTLSVSAVAEYFAEVCSVDELHTALAFAREQDLQYVVLGDGSNVCFSKEEINKLIIHMDIRGIEEKNNEVVVGAGENWDQFVQKGIELDVPYIENLSGIPGTVGASPIQNIGAYGVEVKDMLQYVEVYDTKEKKSKKILNEECQFGYRDSVFKKPKGKKYIVTRVAFKRDVNTDIITDYKDIKNYFEDITPTKEEVRKAVLKIRSGKFPDLETHGTAGSFFKNPIITKKEYERIGLTYSTMPSYPVDNERVKVPLAWILDHVCDLKGYTERNVSLYEKQPLILVTNKQATAEEIQSVSEKIKKIVFEKTKIKIENEVVFVK